MYLTQTIYNKLHYILTLHNEFDYFINSDEVKILNLMQKE